MKPRTLTWLAALAMLATPIAQAVQILRWERLPLAVPLVVGQERIVFVDFNIRVGVPASLGSRLRVQSAAGALYLLASEPVEPTRLHLQDADTGTVILLDIAAEPAQDGQPPLEPVRIAALAELAALRKAGALHRAPEVLVRSAFKLLGYRLGHLERRLPLALKRRISMFPGYWR
mgnify:CR=1 FL=1